MDNWKKINETPLPEKNKGFFSNLNMEDITNANYPQANRVLENVIICMF